MSKYKSTDARVVGWGSGEKQRLCFDTLLSFNEPLLEGATILDVGCGVGHLKEHLDDFYYKVRYHGIDMNEEMVDIATTQYGDHFTHADLMNYRTRHEYVIACGIFNVRDSRYKYQELYDNVDRMVKLATKGVAFNLLSAEVKDNRIPELHYFDAGRVLSSLLELYPKVTIRHDYLPDDFTVYVYK